PTHTADVTDVMTQQRQHKMHPITRRDAAFTEVFAFEDLLAHESNHDGMLHIVIQGITIRDAFEGHMSGPGNDARVGWFEYTIRAVIVLLQALNKGIDHQFRGIEHNVPPRQRVAVRSTPAGGNDTLPMVETLGPTGRAQLAVRSTPAGGNDTLPPVETPGPPGTACRPPS